MGRRRTGTRHGNVYRSVREKQGNVVYRQRVLQIVTSLRVVSLVGSLRKDNDEGNENVKQAIGLDKQNNNFARAARFFVNFSAVVARLQRELTA